MIASVANTVHILTNLMLAIGTLLSPLTDADKARIWWSRGKNENPSSLFPEFMLLTTIVCC